MNRKHLVILIIATLIVFSYTLFFAYVGQPVLQTGADTQTTIFGLNRYWLGSTLVPAVSGTLFPIALYFFYLKPRMEAESV